MNKKIVGDTNPFENKCDRCGKAQRPYKQITGFKVFKSKEKCECGGTFVTFYEGKQMEYADSERIDID